MKIVMCCSETELEPWLEGLRAALPGAQVQIWQRGAPAADYAVVWAPPQAFFDEQPQLKGIFNLGAGVDALMRLRLPAQARIVRLDDAGMAVQMAEYVCHAVIRHFREFDLCAEDARAGRWSTRAPKLRSDFPVGVMGLGVLGQRVVSSLAQFEFPVLGWSRSVKRLEGVRCFAGDEQLGEFLATTRILVCLLPLTPDTRDILCRKTLSQLQAGAYLINVARGAHLVEDDLLALLEDGHLCGAALDVFRTEPLPPEHPFWRHPKIAVTPHSSARTLRETSIAQIASKIVALERGQSVAGLVDPGRGY